ncbi:MAG: biliverdin-producing heme oxygenase [Tsuneonella suprasediminis]|uniref:Heme oxygenase n=1 Tax=Tsuneonella suprasediminis TaxID=2306996 RepID=A0A419R5E4_9SPHN|nr:biliverdin-producing heme oxygenase [Tsuneonella suprasediminis]RJX71141.1 hypothetical protein D6858_00410 [Tsuneonella suprasediminis]UBS34377.1 biliverdin-producing heme oxygenase [Altererythrobacter sp. N1]
MRQSTWSDHETLDTIISALDLSSASGYARFLQIQREARAPIEAWLAENASKDMRPPAQLALIDTDLAELGHSTSASPQSTFDAPRDGVGGVVWAIAGSSMGNRSILADLRRSSPQFPAAFLADPAMPAFFKAIRPHLANPAKSTAQLAASIAAARSVFACFSSAATATREIA